MRYPLAPMSLKHEWTEEETRAGVVKCVTQPNSQTIAGAKADKIVYKFFAGRLYMIEARIARSDYAAVRDAFITKYGKPEVKQETYQNAYGATAVGERATWTNTVSAMSIGERDGVPYPLDYDRSVRTLLLWIHNALYKQVEAAGAVKGREKDL